MWMKLYYSEEEKSDRTYISKKRKIMPGFEAVTYRLKRCVGVTQTEVTTGHHVSFITRKILLY